jgi:WD40 repeat protein
VQSVAFSPDGKLLAIGGADHAIHVIDLATDKEIGPAAEQSSMVVTVAAAPRNKSLAVAWRQVIHVGDPAAGLRRFAEQEDRVSCLAFAPDEKLLASGSDSGTVHIWDMANGKRLHHLIDADERILFLQFTPDGKTLMSGNEDYTLCFWEVATGKLLRHVKDEKKRERLGFGGPAPALALSPDGKVIAMGAEGETVRLLDGATGKELKQLKVGTDEERRDHNITSVAFSPDGAILAVAKQDRAVRLWDVAEGKPIRDWKEEEEKKEKDDDLILTRRGDEMYMVSFSPDGRTLATWFTDRSMRYSFWNDNGGRNDNTIRLWEASTGKERRRLKGHRGGVVCLTFTPDGRSVATGSEDTTLLLWDLTGADARKLSPADLEDQWAALGGEDAAKALRAIGTLAASPADAVPFLQQKLKPVEPVDDKRLEQLIGDLDSNQFAARKKASEELEKYGEQAEGAMRKALKGDPSLETKKRLDELLAKLDKGRRSLSAEQLRVLRAVEALELAGTAEAKQALTKLSSGVPEAWQSREAKSALDRMGRRSGS